MQVSDPRLQTVVGTVLQSSLNMVRVKFFNLALLVVALASPMAMAKTHTTKHKLASVAPVTTHDQSDDAGIYIDTASIEATEVNQVLPAVSALPVEKPNVADEKPDEQTEAAVSTGGACPDGTCSPGLRAQSIRLPDQAPIPVVKPTVVAQSERLDTAPTEALMQQSKSGIAYGNRVAQAAWHAANACRPYANYLRARARKQHRKLPAKGCGWQTSKGMCSAGVREALSEAGVHITGGDAHSQRPKLRKAGLVETKYDPFKVPAGTVLTCDGGHSVCKGGPKGHCGHIEIAIDNAGQRMFCSDFCSPAPTCSKGSYYNATAFKFPGT